MGVEYAGESQPQRVLVDPGKHQETCKTYGNTSSGFGAVILVLVRGSQCGRGSGLNVRAGDRWRRGVLTRVLVCGLLLLLLGLLRRRCAVGRRRGSTRLAIQLVVLTRGSGLFRRGIGPDTCHGPRRGKRSKQHNLLRKVELRNYDFTTRSTQLATTGGSEGSTTKVNKDL
jgi:hypothetical protein